MVIQTSKKVEPVIIAGFLLAILAGALLMWLSNNILHGMPLSPLSSLFLATSAVCVTGLSPLDIGSDLGIASQMILLALIQIGGWGVMTGMTMITMAVGKRLGLKDKVFLLGGLGGDDLGGAAKLLSVVIAYTLFFEGIGASIMFAAFLRDGLPPVTALYYSVFHSISAFCNAGFSPISDGLHGYSGSVLVPAVIMSLIVLGGIGFPVAAECFAALRDKGRRRLSYYTKMVLSLTFWLIFAGALIILMTDWNTAFKGMPVWNKIWAALFASVTTRTAGFDTVAPAAFSGLGLSVMIFLMIVGASPASTGGGIKTTTLGVLLIAVWNELRGRNVSVVMCRRISGGTERRAFALSFLYLATILIAAVVLTGIEDMGFKEVFFEVVSAIGTVGLSLGVTPRFSEAGKTVLIVLMFWGRVGILTFFASLVRPDRESGVVYPETNMPVG